ncbi:MAG: hypothetical protein ACKOZW_08810 [Cyanobium sp.]
MAINLYNAALAALPSAQGWLSFGNSLLASQSLTPNGVLLSSLPLLANAAGFSNVTALLPVLLNPGFPQLDPARGFGLDFRLRILDEQHLVDNRAGFSAILQGMGTAPLGIELGFWRDRIASLLGGPNPLQTVGSWVGGLDLSQRTAFSLRIVDQSFYLFADNRLLLSGPVQDYSKAVVSPLLPFNPYSLANFLFLGDNTTSAGANVELGDVSLQQVRGAGNSGDLLMGTGADDAINGQAGNDELRGRAGDDLLIGAAGADTLKGGIGDDMLIGGSEADAFFFSSGSRFRMSQLGVDTIADFQAGQDQLRLARRTFDVLPSLGTLAASSFAVVNDDAAAALSTAPLVLSTASGELFYNPNGSAAGFGSGPEDGGKFVQLWGGGSGAPFPALGASDIQIVA